MKKLLGAAMIVALFSSPTGSVLLAQSATADGNTVFDPALFEGMRWGGRVTAHRRAGADTESEYHMK